MNTTELIARLKSAIKKATGGQWVAFTHSVSGTYSVHTPDDQRCDDIIKWSGFDGQKNAKENARYIALANPASIAALVEALESAQRKIAELESEKRLLRPVGVMSESRLRALENGESRFIALWPRPGIYLPRKRPSDGVIVYARTGIKCEVKGG